MPILALRKEERLHKPQVSPVPLGAEDNFRYVESLPELHCIQRPEINMAIAQRPAKAAIGDYLEYIARKPWQSLEMCIGRRQIDAIDLLGPELPKAPDLTGQRALIADIKMLAQAYFAVTDAKEVPKATVQLSFITDDMCRLFHADHVGLRMLCTYHGKATEWLTEDNADRSGLGKGRNCGIVRDETKVRRLSEFDVGLLKGSKYPGNCGKGVVHRSPPIVGSDRPWRVMLKIDDHDTF